MAKRCYTTNEEILVKIKEIEKQSHANTIGALTLFLVSITFTLIPSMVPAEFGFSFTTLFFYLILVAAITLLLAGSNYLLYSTDYDGYMTDRLGVYLQKYDKEASVLAVTTFLATITYEQYTVLFFNNNTELRSIISLALWILLTIVGIQLSYKKADKHKPAKKS